MRKYVIASLIFLLTIGCSTKSPLEPEIPNIMPLKVGNSWDYLLSTYDAFGNETQVGSIIETVMGRVSIDSEAWFLLEDISTSSDTETYYLANRRDGSWARDSINASPELYIKYPMSVGDTFEMGGFLGGGAVEVVSLDETVVVPAGSFKCVHFLNDGATLKIHIYFALGKGRIKYVLEAADGYGGFRTYAALNLTGIHLE